AVGASEAVRTALVIGAHAHREVVRSQLYISAAWAVGPDGGHRVTRPWSVSAASVWRYSPFGRAHWALEAPGLPLSSHWTACRRVVARCVAVTVITFAHRGARLEAPENTIPAFRLALDARASGLETDVWCSADGEVVCAHDSVVGRGL